MKKRLGIDLGASHFRVCQRHGALPEEAAVLAVDGEGNVRGAGSEAVSLFLRTPGNLTCIHPLLQQGGLDLAQMKALLSYCIKEKCDELILTVPASLSVTDLECLERAGKEIGIRQVTFLRKSVAAAIGCGKEILDNSFRAVLDLGHSCAEFAAVGEGGAKCVSLPEGGGYAMNLAIMQTARDTFGVVLEERDAERIKRNAGTVRQCDSSRSPEAVRAVRKRDGVPTSVTVTPDMVRQSIGPQMVALSACGKAFFSSLPDSVRQDVYCTGLTLTGGGAAFSGIEKLLEKEWKIPVHIAMGPATCASVGLVKLLTSSRYYECDGRFYCNADIGF